MSVPAPRKKKPSPQEIVSLWNLAFEAVRQELLTYGVDGNRAAEIAAQVAALLARETEYGDKSRII
jgi:hypothetical protein